MEIIKLDTVWENPFKKKLRVAAYTRVSVDTDESEQSLDNQTKSYTDQIKSNPEWEFVDVYEDKGISGTKECRPEFQRMLSDCRAGKIDLILTKSFTRFARNTVVLLKTLRELKDLNIEVFFEKDNIRSLDETGELLITLLAAYAQAEAESASANQLWRFKKTFEEGRTSCGLMMGYRLKDGVLSIIPEEAEVVRMIFNDYLSGMGIRSIAKKLNDKGILTIRHKAWYPYSVKVILTNEKYTGNMLLQKTYSIDPISKKRSKNNGERTQYYVKNSHEAIISQKQFDAVQKLLSERSHEKGPKKEYPKHKKLLLKGKVVCDVCGKHYWRIDNHRDKAVWDCGGKITNGRKYCNNCRIPESVLHNATRFALGIDNLNTEALRPLKEIRVMKPNYLKYVFQDGTEQNICWNKSQNVDSDAVINSKIVLAPATITNGKEE